MNKESILLRRKEHESFQGVRFIGFDLDGTLFAEPKKNFPQVFATLISPTLHIPFERAENFAAETMGIATKQQLAMLPDTLNIPQTHILRQLPTELQEIIAQAIDLQFFNQPVDLFPEITKTLGKLQKSNVRLFISSSRPTENIQTLLKLHPELATHIEFAIGTDTNDPSLKKGESHFRKAAEHFHMPFENFVQQSIFIGDTPSDMQAAQSIGVRAIGRVGTTLPENLLHHGASLVLHDFSSLPHLLNSRRKLFSAGKYGRR